MIARKIIRGFIEKIILALLTTPANTSELLFDHYEYDLTQTLENYIEIKVVYYNDWLEDNVSLIEEYKSTKDKCELDELLVILMEPIFNMFPLLDSAYNYSIEHNEHFDKIVHNFIINN